MATLGAWLPGRRRDTGEYSEGVALQQCAAEGLRPPAWLEKRGSPSLGTHRAHNHTHQQLPSPTALVGAARRGVDGPPRRQSPKAPQKQSGLADCTEAARGWQRHRPAPNRLGALTAITTAAVHCTRRAVWGHWRLRHPRRAAPPKAVGSGAPQRGRIFQRAAAPCRPTRPRGGVGWGLSRALTSPAALAPARIPCRRAAGPTARAPAPRRPRGGLEWPGSAASAAIAATNALEEPGPL
jgi:hypothetical protein